MWQTPNENDVIEVIIEKLGDKGDGIGKTKSGLVIIVKGAKVGQKVKAKINKVKPTFCFAEIAEVISENNPVNPSGSSSKTKGEARRDSSRRF